MKLSRKFGAFAALAALYAAACTSAPVTGRSQLMLFSVDQEIQLGLDAYAETTANATVITSGDQYEMVQRIGRRISETATRYYPDPAGRFQWEFKLIDAPDTMNAWVLPGGKGAVYTGLFQATPDENSLAIVMGHEVAHALARHGGERMSHSSLYETGMAAGSLALGSMNGVERDMVMSGFALATQTGILLPYSREHETEADEIGLYLAATSLYDPRAAIGVWERMAELGGEAPTEWLSTHPNPQTRINDFKAIMPIAMNYYQAALRKAGLPPANE